MKRNRFEQIAMLIALFVLLVALGQLMSPAYAGPGNECSDLCTINGQPSGCFDEDCNHVVNPQTRCYWPGVGWETCDHWCGPDPCK